jgi:uncharacterized protein YqhQ
MSEYLQYGGQAVIEGVMMRSPRYFAVACRKPNGEVVVQQEPVEHSFVGKLRFLNRPFLRGSLALIDAMALGMRALSFSASVQAAAINEASSKPAETASGEGDGGPIDRTANRSSRINDIAIGTTMVISICLGIGLFVALPTWLTQLAQNHLGVRTDVGRNLLDGVIRIIIFLGYIAAIGRLKNIHRVFQYHGAEHKAINTLESGQELTLERCLRSSRIHPRCGTSFVIVVLLVSVLVHCLFPRPEVAPVRIALHIALIPLVAGASYELIRLAGRMRNARFLQMLLAPGLWTQHLTTREPDPDQVEVALTALQTVLAREQAPSGEAATAVA